MLKGRSRSVDRPSLTIFSLNRDRISACNVEYELIIIIFAESNVGIGEDVLRNLDIAAACVFYKSACE